jgi:hypothetical protein
MLILYSFVVGTIVKVAFAVFAFTIVISGYTKTPVFTLRTSVRKEFAFKLCTNE